MKSKRSYDAILPVAIVQALSDLFQACSGLPLDEMNRMASEITAASDALKDIPADLMIREFPDGKSNL